MSEVRENQRATQTATPLNEDIARKLRKAERDIIDLTNRLLTEKMINYAIQETAVKFFSPLFIESFIKKLNYETKVLNDSLNL